MKEFDNLYDQINFCIRCGNELEIREDREEKERPQCNKCGWIYYKNPIPAVACVVINEAHEVLLIKRKFEPKPNEWALPSGYMEIWQSPEQAAIDELEEETGLIGEVESFIDYYNGFSPIYLRVLSLGFVMKIKGGRLQAGDDALEAKFYSVGALPPIAFKSHIHFLRKINYIK